MFHPGNGQLHNSCHQDNHSHAGHYAKSPSQSQTQNMHQGTLSSRNCVCRILGGAFKRSLSGVAHVWASLELARAYMLARLLTVRSQSKSDFFLLLGCLQSSTAPHAAGISRAHQKMTLFCDQPWRHEKYQRGLGIYGHMVQKLRTLGERKCSFIWGLPEWQSEGEQAP